MIKKLLLFLNFTWTALCQCGSSGVVVSAGVACSASQIVQAAAFETTPQDYGAKCDGVTNDKPAFDAAFTAIKAVGGGILHVPACPAHYIYVNDNNFTNTQTFTLEASNIIVEGEGMNSIIEFTGGAGVKGVVLGLPRADINRYCTTPPSTGCSSTAWGLPSYKLVNNITTGGKTVVTTTAGDAAAFTAGGIVFIESGNASPGTGNPPAHWEYNQVATSNAGTGVVTLVYDLLDQYDSSNASYVPMMAQISVVPHDIVIRNLHFVTSQAGSIIVDPVGTIDTSIQDNYFECLANAQCIIFNSVSQRVTFRGNKFWGVSADLGDNARYFKMENNKILNNWQSWIVSGAAKDYYFNHNLFETWGGQTDPAWGLQISGQTGFPATKMYVEDNEFVLSGTNQFGGAISMFTTTNSSIRRNKVVGTSTAASNQQGGIVLGANVTNVTVSDNLIQSTNLQTGIRIDSGASGNTVGCNQVTSPTIFSDAGTTTTRSCGSFAPTTQGNLPASIPPASSQIYCTDCTVASVCAPSGTGHMATSNGTAWTCN